MVLYIFINSLHKSGKYMETCSHSYINHYCDNKIDNYIEKQYYETYYDYEYIF